MTEEGEYFKPPIFNNEEEPEDQEEPEKKEEKPKQGIKEEELTPEQKITYHLEKLKEEIINYEGEDDLRIVMNCTEYLTMSCLDQDRYKEIIHEIEMFKMWIITNYLKDEYQKREWYS